MGRSVAVIGAGPLGLMALKNFREDGFDVTCYEARPHIGGLWKYSTDMGLSVCENTIFNTSKYRSAISDFPFPDHFDDFPTWQQVHSYLESYCDHFHLREYIHLNSRVSRLDRERKQWILEIDSPGSASRRDRFDKVFVATGSFVAPKLPNIPGIEVFEGSHKHAVNFHKSSDYKDKRVLLVGLHATAQDVAKTLAGHASKLYISYRSGVVPVSRYTTAGDTFDQFQTLSFILWQSLITMWFPTLMDWIVDKFIHHQSAKDFPNSQSFWRLAPAPHTAVSPALIADEIMSLCESGFVELVPGIRRIRGPRSIELTDGHIVEDIDAIVYCTGYNTCVPFKMPKEFDPYPVVGEAPQLYHGIFPLHEDPNIRNSLAFAGHSIVLFSGFTQYEMVGMAASQIWQEKSTLPPLQEMRKWHRKFLTWRQDLAKRHGAPSTFYVPLQPFPEYLLWLDKVAGTGVFEHFGWLTGKAWSFWWHDRDFYQLCLNGLFTPAIWRLFETGKRRSWPGAREQIVRDNAAAKRQIQNRLKMLKGTVR